MGRTLQLALAAVLGACAAPRAAPGALVAVPQTAPPPTPRAWQEEPSNDLPMAGHSDLGPGVELQAYPTGAIAAFHLRYGLTPRDVLTVRFGYNATDRGDAGEHADESGGGPGFGVGYRRYARTTREGFLYGFRADLWWLDVDWEDAGGAASGTTDVLVWMPAVEAGYAWRVGRRWWLDLGLAVGAEINVDTDGEDVGEGAIALLGATLVYGF